MADPEQDACAARGLPQAVHHDFARRALAEAQFRSVDQPVTREYLAAQHVGPPFIDYLAEGWKDFVRRRSWRPTTDQASPDTK